MDFILYFCKDGILRAKLSENKPALPLDFIQTALKQTDLKFWSYWWDNPTCFEEGLTVAKFMQCLSPWKGFWGDFLNKNIQAYIQESCKPTLVDKNSNHCNLDWIYLSFSTEVQLAVSYEREELNDLSKINLEKFLNQSKKKLYNGNFEVNPQYQLTGYKKDEVEHYGVEGYPLNEIANIPLYLDPHQYFYYLNSLHPDKKGEEIFNLSAYGLHHLGNFKEGRGDYHYFKAEKTHTFRDILEGFFQWFSYDISAREELHEIIKSSLDDLPDELTLKQDIDTPDSHTPQDTAKYTVKVAPNAFDDVFAHFKRQENFWDKLVQEANNAPCIPRIGTIEKGILPENRLFGFLLENEQVSLIEKSDTTKKPKF